jgi:hypothetical protein
MSAHFPFLFSVLCKSESWDGRVSLPGKTPGVYKKVRTLKMGGSSVALVRSVKERDNNVPFIAKVVHMLCTSHQDTVGVEVKL